MAREIQYGPAATGLTTLRAYLLRAFDGYMRDLVGAVWEVPGTSATTDYDIPLTEDGATGFYTADAPAGVTLDGTVSVLVFDQAVPAFDYTAYVGEGRAIRADVHAWKGATAPAMTGDAFARLGAPAGASVSADVASVYSRQGAPAGASQSADIAAVKADTAAILIDTGTTLDGRIPAALVGGRMDSSTGAMEANVLTAAAIAADAITDAKVASDVTIASVTGTVGGLSAAAKAEVEAEVLDALNAYDPATGAEAAAIAAAIAALDDLSSAQVQTACAAALNAYDPATGAEAAAISALISALNDVTAAEIVTALYTQTVDGAVDFEEAIQSIVAYVRGKIVKTGDNYAYKKQDTTTTLFTNLKGASTRTPV